MKKTASVALVFSMLQSPLIIADDFSVALDFKSSHSNVSSMSQQNHNLQQNPWKISDLLIKQRLSYKSKKLSNLITQQTKHEQYDGDYWRLIVGNPPKI